MSARTWSETPTQIAIRADVLTNEMRDLFVRFKPEIIRTAPDGHMPVLAYLIEQKLLQLHFETQRLRERIEQKDRAWRVPASIAAVATSLSQSPPVVTDNTPMAKVIPLFRRPEPGPFAGDTQ
ncbi:MAG TPA: hypothetical protein VK550_13525 [Polyangiaceae bacterium]|nr:hypothetical protein [Polyangiaceae bacterium]